MFFGKRDKKTPNDRVVDLKARVDALRQADQATRRKAQSLDQFLEGDDVLTGREVEDSYQPTSFAPGEVPAHQNEYEAALAAELEKYLQREEARALQKEQAAPTPALPQPPSPSEPSSLLLDGTWSRDADQRANLTAADRAWGVPDIDVTRVAPRDDAAGPTDPRPARGVETDWREGEEAV